MKTRLLVMTLLLALAAPGVLLAQGELTLEGLARQVERLAGQVERLAESVERNSTAHEELAERLAAVETALAPTATPTATATAAPTATPTATVTPTPTATPAQARLTVNRSMNVRRGPGTNFAIIGSAQPGDPFTITGRNAAGDWWRIAFGGGNAWLYAAYTTAEYAANVAVVAAPTPVPTPTPDPAAAAARREASYRAEVLAMLADDGSGRGIHGAIDHLLDVWSEAAADNGLLKDDAWVMRFRNALAGLRAPHERALAMEPPPGYDAFHAAVVQALAHCRAMEDLIDEGLFAADLGLLRAGRDAMGACIDQSEQALSHPQWTGQGR